jgi:hypothetical protein
MSFLGKKSRLECLLGLVKGATAPRTAQAELDEALFEGSQQGFVKLSLSGVSGSVSLLRHNQRSEFLNLAFATRSRMDLIAALADAAI